MNYSDQAKAIQRIDLDLKFSSRNFIPEQQNNYTNLYPFQIKENLNSHLYTHVIPYAASIKDSARAQVKEIDVDKQIRQEPFSQQSSQKNQKDFHLHQKIQQIIENSDLDVQDKMEKIRQTQRNLQYSYPEYEYVNKANLNDNQNQGIERYAYINQRQMQQQQEYQQQIYELNQQQSLKPMNRQTGSLSQQYPFQNQESYDQYFSQIPIQPIYKNVQTTYKPSSTNKISKRQASPQRKTSTASQTIEANQGINQENTFQRQSKKLTYQQNLLDSQKFYEPTPPSQTVELALKLKANQKELNRIQEQQQVRILRKQDKTNYQLNPRNTRQPGRQTMNSNYKAYDQKFEVQSFNYPVREQNVNQNEQLQHLLMNAKRLMYEQKYQQAEKILSSEIDKGIFHSDLFYLYAELKRLQGEWQEAEFYFTNCISAKQHSPFAYFGLGLIYSQKQELNLAIQMFRTFLEQVDTVDGRFQLAKCLIEVNESLEAAIHLTKAVELFNQQQMQGPEKIQQLILLLLQRADVYEQIGFDELAIEDYRKIREIDPKFYKEYLIEAQKLEEQGNFAESEKIRNFVRKLFM